MYVIFISITLVGGLVDGGERQLSDETAGLFATIRVGEPETTKTQKLNNLY